VFRHAIPIGRIFGISIDLDYSWFLIVGLFTWMLAVGYFPAEFPAPSPGQDWAMGFVAAVMLFVCVLIHELGHSVVAQLNGLRVPRITLFLFGGVSQIAAEPGSPGQEFWIAVVGPLVSFALAAFFWEIEPLLAHLSPWQAVASCLALMNLVLALFNLIPGFPLDGGRVLRAIIWRATGRYQRATVAAAITGRFVGFLMIAFGIWEIFRGALIDGLWIAFIGWYLESAAGSQLQMESTRALMGQHRVADAMRRDFPRIQGDITLQILVDHFVLSESNRYFVVSDGISGEGLITLSTIRTVPREAWPVTTAAQVMIPAAALDTTTPEAGLWAALEKMGRDGVNQLPVVEGSRIVGILSREDILQYLRVLETFAAGPMAAANNSRGARRIFPASKGHTHLP
jgi:Zn-dependent protease/predicted transcriptional regulator